MTRSILLSSLVGIAALASPSLAQDSPPTLLDRLAANGVTFSGTSLDSDAVIDIGDSQDLYLYTDGALEVRDRESDDLLLSGIATYQRVNKDSITLLLTNGTHNFRVLVEASSLTHTGVVIDGTVTSNGRTHLFAPLWVEDTADNAELLAQVQPVPIPIPQDPPMRGKYACICGWTNPDGTTGYRIGCAKQDCNIQTTCTSDGKAPSSTTPTDPSTTNSSSSSSNSTGANSGTGGTQAAALAAANITGRCMWVDSSDPNGAATPAIMIGVLSSSTLAGFAGLALLRRRRVSSKPNA
ncbi:MAG: hypothetical protein IT438_10210 [Phycisphaerales bacterium]|nr:hypothetical protein [Phycisphaerales bacterium]